MVFIPPIHSDIASSMVSMRSPTAITIATMDARSAAWKSATEASDCDNASNIPLNDNGEVFIKVMRAWSSPPKMVVYPLQ